MTAPELTLQKAKETIKVREHRASDFLTAEQIEEVKKSNLKGKTKRFNEIDAYIAEILARFGYDTYIAWKNGDIDENAMVKYIDAERVREARDRFTLESLLYACMAGANNPTKNGFLPKSLKVAYNILKSEEKIAEGK